MQTVNRSNLLIFSIHLISWFCKIVLKLFEGVSKKKEKMDFLVLWLCLFNVVGTTPRNIMYILGFFLNSSLSIFQIILACAAVMHHLTHGCSIFILVSFNKLFRSVLTSYFKTNFKLNFFNNL